MQRENYNPEFIRKSYIFIVENKETPIYEKLQNQWGVCGIDIARVAGDEQLEQAIQQTRRMDKVLIILPAEMQESAEKILETRADNHYLIVYGEQEEKITENTQKNIEHSFYYYGATKTPYHLSMIESLTRTFIKYYDDTHHARIHNSGLGHVSQEIPFLNAFLLTTEATHA